MNLNRKALLSTAFILLAALILPISFVNCSGQSPMGEGFNTSNSKNALLGGKGNGNGYVGIDAPVAVKAGHTFVATVYGGTGPYKFNIDSGSATILKVEDNQVSIAVSEGAEGENIEFSVVDNNGESAFATTFVLEIFDPYNLRPDFKMLSEAPPRVKLKNNRVLISHDKNLHYRFKMIEKEHGREFNYEGTPAGYMTLMEHDGNGKNWRNLLHIRGEDLANKVAHLYNETELIPYNFGETSDFNHQQIAVDFLFYRMNSDLNLRDRSLLDRAIILFQPSDSIEGLDVNQVIPIANNFGRDSNFKEQIKLVDKFLFMTRNRRVNGSDYVDVYKKIDQKFELTTSIEIDVVSTEIKSLHFVNDELYVFSAPILSGKIKFKTDSSAQVSIYKEQSDGQWTLQELVKQTVSGTTTAVDIKEDALVMTTVRAAKRSSGVQYYDQSLSVFNRKNSKWQLSQTLKYKDYSVCRSIAFSAKGSVQVGCPVGHMGMTDSKSYLAAYENENISMHELAGTVISFYEVSTGFWRQGPKLHDPSNYKMNYYNFGADLSGDQGFFAVSHGFNDTVKIYRSPVVAQ